MNAHQNTSNRSPDALPASSGQNWLSRLLAFALSSGLLVLGFMFSLVALAIIGIVGTILGGWLWWKTRQLRKQMRQPMSRTEGHPLEGDLIHNSADLTTSYRRID